MNTLWNEQTAAEATGGEARGHWHASRVEIDSRKVQLGDLFVAIKGEHVDGHHYVADALARGAVAAVVSEVPEGLPQGCSLLVVKDTMEALVAMAKYSRARTKAKIIGVTGSVGKTTTKEMIKLGLAANGKTYATMGNFNNHIGTPLSLANLPQDAEFGVFEMGMNHAGEIRYLGEMVRPHVAVITNVEAAHLEFFKDVQAIADAKAEIFEHMAEGGVAVLPADNAYCDYLREKAGALPVITFGEKVGSDVQILSYEPSKRGGEMIITVAGKLLAFTMRAYGKHFSQTAACALGVAKALGLPLPKTATACADFAVGNGRGVLQPVTLVRGNAWLIDDSYNASPASMAAAIARTDELWQLMGKHGRKLAILGDMLELGKDAPQMHAALADVLIKHGFHMVFTAGALMQHLTAALPREMRGQHMMQAKTLFPILQKVVWQNDVMLIKGSHGSKMHELASLIPLRTGGTAGAGQEAEA